MRFPILLLLTLFIPLFGAVEPGYGMHLPTPAFDAVLTYEREAAILKANYDSKIAALAETARVKIVKAQETATKAGNLDAALACKEAAAKFAAPDSVKAVKSEQSHIAGSWRFSGWQAVVTLKADGTVQATDGTQGKWTVVNDRLRCEYSRGRWHEFSLPISDGSRGDSWNWGKNSVTLTRVAE
jgi:hypothetical protein